MYIAEIEQKKEKKFIFKTGKEKKKKQFEQFEQLLKKEKEAWHG